MVDSRGHTHVYSFFSVRITDETKLRTAGLQSVFDESGNFEGAMDFELMHGIDGIAAQVLGDIAFEAWRARADEIGVEFVAGNALAARPQDGDGTYPEVVLLPMLANGTIRMPGVNE